jgi:hypothetical protein
MPRIHFDDGDRYAKLGGSAPPLPRVRARVVRAARLAFWTAPLALSLAFVVSVLWLAVRRVPYPYELEWMEGGAVAQVDRILHGRPIYAAPSVDFVPFIYPPLYFYLSAAVARVVGVGFVALRLVSVAASLGVGAFIWLRVRNAYGATRYAAAVAVGLYFGSFFVTGAWFDVGRVDNLFVFFLMAALWILQCGGSAKSDALAALLMFFAFFTKQSALLVAIPVALWCVAFQRGYRRLSFPAVFISLAAISVVAMQRATDGWYAYYVFSLPSQHPIVRQAIHRFWTEDILGHAAILTLLAVAALLHRAQTADRPSRAFDVAALGSILCASWFSRIHEGGWINVLIPAYAELAVYAGVGLHAVLSDARLEVARVTAYIGVALQFVCLHSWPPHQVPHGAAEGRAFVARLGSVPGEVYVPSHGWYAALAGKRTYAQSQAIKDITRADRSEELASKLSRSILDKIAREDFDYVVLTWEDDFVAGSVELAQHYSRVTTELTGADFTPITGGQVRPLELYVSHRLRPVDADGARARPPSTGNLEHVL